MDGNTITVRHTLTRLKGKFFLGTPKTKGSGRMVNIPPELIEDLKAHKQRQDEMGAQFGADWKSVGQVFTNESGDYHSRSLVNAKFQRLLTKNSIQGFTTHDLRHANASLLINAGIPAKMVADHLGHSNTKTTENVYAHVFAASRAKVTETIVNTLRGEFSDAPAQN